MTLWFGCFGLLNFASATNSCFSKFILRERLGDNVWVWSVTLYSMQNLIKITLSDLFLGSRGRGGWRPGEIINPCQAGKAKQRACNAAESRDPLSPISRFYPTAQGFKTTDCSPCQMSDLSLCRTNMLYYWTQVFASLQDFIIQINTTPKVESVVLIWLLAFSSVSAVLLPVFGKQRCRQHLSVCTATSSWRTPNGRVQTPQRANKLQRDRCRGIISCL